MRATDGQRYLLSQFIYTSGITSLIAAAVCSFFAASWIKKINDHRDAVWVDSVSWARFADIKFRWDRPDAQGPAQTTNPTILGQVPQTSQIEDQVRVSAAAPKARVRRAKHVVHAPVPLPKKAEVAEADKIQALHRSLHARLLSVFKGAPETAVAVAQAQPIPPPRAMTIHLKKRKATHSRVVAQIVRKQEKAPPAVVAEVAPTPLPLITSQKNVNIKASQSEPQASSPQAVIQKVESRPAFVAQPTIQPPIPLINEVKEADRILISQAATTPTELSAEKATPPALTGTPMTQWSGYSNRYDYSKLSVALAQVVDSQPNIQASEKKAQESSRHREDSLRGNEGQGPGQAKVPNIPILEDVRICTHCVQAFDWDYTIPGIEQKVVSAEFLGSLESRGGWLISSPKNYWPTLYWQSSKENERAALISENSVGALVSQMGIQLQPQMSLVWGRIPSGWKVEYSDRAESARYTTAKGEVLDGPDKTAGPGGESYFFLFNAAPRANILYLTNTEGKSAGAIALPAKPATATYLDLFNQKVSTVSGNVWDAESDEGKGRKNILMTIVGAEDRSAFTKEEGRFSIPGVVTFGTYPFFVEADRKTTYKHRYRVHPNAMSDVSLYLMRARQIDDLYAQAQSTSSAQGGFAIGAFPQVGHAIPELYSQVTPLQFEMDRPYRSVFPVDQLGGLMASGTKLDVTSPKFIALDLPEGAAIAKLENRDKRLLWSELIVSSPGVINIIGPY